MVSVGIYDIRGLCRDMLPDMGLTLEPSNANQYCAIAWYDDSRIFQGQDAKRGTIQPDTVPRQARNREAR
jgi:hypothetical protein